MKDEIKKILTAYLFPKVCSCCLEAIDPIDEGLVCANCKEKFISDLIKRNVSDKVICYSYCKYGGVARDAIINLKFRRFGFVAKLLGEKLAIIYDVSLKQNSVENTVVIPLPVSRRRKIDRGYNQCELIAMTFSTKTGIEVISGAVRKVKNNYAQSLSSSVEERRENVKGVYRVINPDAITGKDVIVIDDVITTGSTLREFTDLLLPYAKSVVCLTVASAEIDNDD